VIKIKIRSVASVAILAAVAAGSVSACGSTGTAAVQTKPAAPVADAGDHWRVDDNGKAVPCTPRTEGPEIYRWYGCMTHAAAMQNASASSASEKSVDCSGSVASRPVSCTGPETPTAWQQKADSNNGWSISWKSFKASCDSLDQVGAVARLTNNTGRTANASWTLTALKSGSIVATVSGNGNHVGPGATLTVRFIGTDSCFSGQANWTMQTDYSYGV
jgi:hypothetical protein